MTFMSKEYGGIRTVTEATITIKRTDCLPYQHRLSRLELVSLEERRLKGLCWKSLVIIISGRR